MYTTEEETTVVKQYQANVPLEDIATSVGKSVKSVVAKLAAIGIYKTKEVTTKAKVTKADLVALIEGRYAVDAGALADLEKCSKATLLLLARED